MNDTTSRSALLPAIESDDLNHYNTSGDDKPGNPRAVLRELIMADSDTKTAVAFSLMGKVNGRIFSYAGQLVGRARAVGAGGGIDAFNDLCAALDEMGVEDLVRDGFGWDKPADPAEELARWLGVRVLLAGHGYTPHEFAETAKFLMAKSIEDTPKWSEADLEVAAKATGISAADLAKAKETDRARDLKRQQERLIQAVQLIRDTAPDTAELPATFSTIAMDAMRSAKLGAIRRGKTLTDSLGTLMLIKRIEDADKPDDEDTDD